MVQVFNWAFAKKSELGDPVGDKEITEDVRAEVGRSMLQTQLARSQCDVMSIMSRHQHHQTLVRSILAWSFLLQILFSSGSLHWDHL